MLRDGHGNIFSTLSQKEEKSIRHLIAGFWLKQRQVNMLKGENGVNIIPEQRAKVSRTAFKYMDKYYIGTLLTR